MSRTARRVAAVIAGWYSLGGLILGLMLGVSAAAPAPALLGAALGICGGAAAVGLWQGRHWAPAAVYALGVAGAVVPVALVAAVAPAITREMWTADAFGAALFFGVCHLVARSVARASRPAI